MSPVVKSVILLSLLLVPACAPVCPPRVAVTEPAAVYYGRRLEPAAGRIIHGAGQSSPEDFEYVRACPPNNRPMVLMAYGGPVYPHREPAGHPAGATQPGTATAPATRPAERPLDWHRPWLAKLDQITGSLTIPQIGFGMSGKGDVDDINHGVRDAAIDQFCDELKSLHRPVFLRIGYEFNGEWNKYEPESYKRAFVRVVSALRRNHCDQVAVVWCFATEGMDHDFMRYYPGDEYVDWWGIDVFSPEHLTSGLTKLFVTEAAAHRFPVMIGESAPRWLGARQGELSWRGWFKPYIKLLRENPNIKCFCLIVDDWNRTYKLPSPLHDWGDGRLWLDPYVWAGWREELADPHYLHALPAEETARALHVAPASTQKPTP